MRSLGRSPVWAAGNIAEFHNHVYDARTRLKHWTSASEQAALLARARRSGPSTARASVDLPFVWSDQDEVRLQHVSDPDLADVAVTEQIEGYGVLYAYHRDGEVVGGTAFDAPRAMSQLRRELRSRLPGSA